MEEIIIREFDTVPWAIVQRLQLTVIRIPESGEWTILAGFLHRPKSLPGHGSNLFYKHLVVPLCLEQIFSVEIEQFASGLRT